MTTCFEGWKIDDGNETGRCCCNCQFHVKIMRHPWNTQVGGRMRGPVTEIAGWGCNQPEFEGIIYFERKHSVCELHTWKDTHD